MSADPSWFCQCRLEYCGITAGMLWRSELVWSFVLYVWGVKISLYEKIMFLENPDCHCSFSLKALILEGLARLTIVESYRLRTEPCYLRCLDGQIDINFKMIVTTFQTHSQDCDKYPHVASVGYASARIKIKIGKTNREITLGIVSNNHCRPIR
jgi:hypothetical protein